MTVAGYLSLGENTPSFIASRPSIPGQSDILFTFAQLGIALAMIISICLRLISNKDVIENLVVFLKPEDYPEGSPSRTKLNAFILIGQGLLGFFFALLVNKNLIRFISLMSSVLCPSFIIIYPAMMNLKLAEELKLSYRRQVLIKMFMYGFTLLLCGSIVKDTYDYIFSDKDIIG